MRRRLLLSKALLTAAQAIATLLAFSCSEEMPIATIGRQTAPTDPSNADAGSSLTLESTIQDVSADELGGDCTTLRREALGQVETVSQASVLVLEESDTSRVLFVDASAGGFQAAAMNPYVYVNLTTATRVAVGDLEADASTDWDLAFRRFTIRTNSADSGPGDGGALAYETNFGSLTLSAVQHEDFATDNFIDEISCETVAGDPGVGGVWTPFSAWYEYDETTMILTPQNVVYVVRGADGESLFKLQIQDYYATPEGTRGPVSGRYLLRYAAL